MQALAVSRPAPQPKAAKPGRQPRVTRDMVAMDPALQVDSLTPEAEAGIRAEYQRIKDWYDAPPGTYPAMPEVARLFASSGLTAQGWARVVGWR